jgi:hypothetical protein
MTSELQNGNTFERGGDLQEQKIQQDGQIAFGDRIVASLSVPR